MKTKMLSHHKSYIPNKTELALNSKSPWETAMERGRFFSASKTQQNTETQQFKIHQKQSLMSKRTQY